MAAPVWVLSVDLQTKTATFTSGMADAAKSARGAFSEIRDGAGKMGREVGGSMKDARDSVQFLAEGFGVQLPREVRAVYCGDRASWRGHECRISIPGNHRRSCSPD